MRFQKYPESSGRGLSLELPAPFIQRKDRDPVPRGCNIFFLKNSWGEGGGEGVKVETRVCQNRKLDYEF